MQRDRVAHCSEQDDAFFTTGSRREADLRFLLLAVRWLRESCQAAAKLTTDAGLREAIELFDRHLPHAKSMRNVREHFGGRIGRDWNSIDDRIPGGNAFVRRVGTESRYYMTTWVGDFSTFIWAGKEIHLDLMVPVGERLCAALQSLITGRTVRARFGATPRPLPRG